MIYEYILTAFKVLVGLINHERLAIAAMIGIAIMLIWILFSLVFSFQSRFTRGVRKINEFVSRNGLNAKGGLNDLVAKMPSEFIRGYNAFQMNPHTLPSENIKRFESLDVELNGGVFNQNKSILKTYTNVIFVALLLFSVAIISQETNLTGYLIAEAFVIPFSFMFVARIVYYVYTAIRQHQYRVAVDEFHEMLDNMDRASTGYAAATLGLKPKQEFVSRDREVVLDESLKNQKKNVEVKTETPIVEEKQEVVEIKEEVVKPLVKEIEPAKEEVVKIEESKEEEKTQVPKVKKENKRRTEVKKPLQAPIVEAKTPVVEDSKYEDNFKPDFSDLLEGEEVVEEKRKRGRPRKEVSETGELVIKNEKDFEDALVRAEKLMRKSEEGLSASQTKRIEKQIKELVDAMTKYKEGK